MAPAASHIVREEYRADSILPVTRLAWHGGRPELDCCGSWEQPLSIAVLDAARKAAQAAQVLPDICRTTPVHG